MYILNNIAIILAPGGASQHKDLCSKKGVQEHGSHVNALYYDDALYIMGMMGGDGRTVPERGLQYHDCEGSYACAARVCGEGSYGCSGPHPQTTPEPSRLRA